MPAATAAEPHTNAQVAQRFRGRIALVTGAASGIGLASAVRLAQEGATVVASDIRAGEDIAGHIGNGATFTICDVSDEKSVRAAIAAVVERHGGLDILVNAAGVPHAKTVLDTSDGDWDRVLAVNLKGVFLMCRAAIPVMRGRAGASIVNIASELGTVGQAACAAYCASKGGVIQLTRAMAIDHAADGIRINAVCPGPVDTPLLEAFMQAGADPAAARNEQRNATLLGRFGEPREIAATVAFVASCEASYMTGASVLVDGGVTAR